MKIQKKSGEGVGGGGVQEDPVGGGGLRVDVNKELKLL